MSTCKDKFHMILSQNTESCTRQIMGMGMMITNPAQLGTTPCQDRGTPKNELK